MTVIDTLLVLIKGDNSDLAKKTKQSRDEMSRFAKETDKLGINLEKTWKKAASLAGGLTVIGGLTWGIKLAAQAETARVQFEVLTGSAALAKKTLEDLRKFAGETPLTRREVTAAGQKLLAFGSSPGELTRELRQIGDIAGLTGNRIEDLAVLYGKARVAGTLYAEDVNQLTERGIPVIQEFAKQLGVGADQVKKLGSEGKITFENLQQAFADLTGEGGKFAGGMEKQSETVAGRWSKLADAAETLATSVGTRLLPVMEEWLNKAERLAKLLGLDNTPDDPNSVVGDTALVRMGKARRGAIGTAIMGALGFERTDGLTASEVALQGLSGQTAALAGSQQFLNENRGRRAGAGLAAMAASRMNDFFRKREERQEANAFMVEGRHRALIARQANRMPRAFGMAAGMTPTEMARGGMIGDLIRGAAGGITGGMDALGGLAPGAAAAGDKIKELAESLTGGGPDKFGRNTAVLKGSAEAQRLEELDRMQADLDVERNERLRAIDDATAAAATTLSAIAKKGLGALGL